MSETRKLAAILVADVVGYSRLAGADEEGTLARLRALRSDLIDPSVAPHHGRIVKRTGDGSITEFRSVVNAVRCAVEVQSGMVERDAGLPQERRIEFRVGVHLGDVVEESDGDLMGDGVNIAARLEGVAKPGAICLSEDAYRQVKGRLDLKVSDLGSTQLKNIAEPVRIYAWEIGAQAHAKVATPSTANLRRRACREGAQRWRCRLSQSPSCSPLAPPLGMSRPPTDPRPSHRRHRPTPRTSPSSCYRSPIFPAIPPKTISPTALPRTSPPTSLAFAAPSSSLATPPSLSRAGMPTPRQIGKEPLGVRYVLEGSVQRYQNWVRVNAQLIDAESGPHLWADRFDRPFADLFSMQDDIVASLASQLNVELMVNEARRAEQAPNPTRWTSISRACLGSIRDGMPKI